MKRPADRERTSKKLKTRGHGGSHENGGERVRGDEEEEEEGVDAVAPSDPDPVSAARRQDLVKRTIQEMVRSRRMGEIFLQDGPCFQVSSKSNEKSGSR